MNGSVTPASGESYFFRRSGQQAIEVRNGRDMEQTLCYTVIAVVEKQAAVQRELPIKQRWLPWWAISWREYGVMPTHRKKLI